MSTRMTLHYHGDLHIYADLALDTSSLGVCVFIDGPHAKSTTEITLPWKACEAIEKWVRDQRERNPQ